MAGTDENRPLLRPEGEPVSPESQGLTLRRSVIIPSLVLYFFGLGIYGYVPPEYLHKYFMDKQNATGYFNPCSTNKSDPDYQIYTHAQQEAAMWLNYFRAASSGPAILTTLIWTSYSDIIGRKFILILCSTGMLIKLVIITVVISFKANLTFIILANVIDGISGSVITLFAVLFSFVADITQSGANRTIFIVLVELMVGVTITISSFATGYFIKSSGFVYPMITSVLLTLSAIILIAVLLPETHLNRRRGSVRVFLSNVSAAFNLYRTGSKVRIAKYCLLITSFLFLVIPSLNRDSLETLYQLGRPFCWSATKIGYFGTIRIGLSSFMGLLCVVMLRKCVADDSISAISAIITIASFIVEGMAKTDTIMYIVPVIAGMSFVPIPMIRSLMSHMTPADKQGALFASIGSIETICDLVGGLTNNLVYAATLSVMNGFVFYLLALITAVGLVVMIAPFFYYGPLSKDSLLITRFATVAQPTGFQKEVFMFVKRRYSDVDNHSIHHERDVVN